MKHFIITQTNSCHILWLWDSIKEDFEKLAEGKWSKVSSSGKEARIGNQSDDFRFFGIEHDKLFQSPEHCSDVTNHQDYLLYQKEDNWYLHQDKNADDDKLLGQADYYTTPLGQGTFYVQELSEEEYILSFLVHSGKYFFQKKYTEPYFTSDEFVIIERNDGYYDIYNCGFPEDREAVKIVNEDKTEIYSYINKIKAYGFVAEEENDNIIFLTNAYLITEKQSKRAKLFAIDQEKVTLIDEGKYKPCSYKFLFYLNNKAYPYPYSYIEWEKVTPTRWGKIKNFFKKLF